MSMDMFNNVLENIDENYLSSLPPKLILALLINVGICVIALGVIFIWYKRKTTLSSSTMGYLIKLVPSLGDDTPSLISLLPILSELTSCKTETKITPTTASTVHQTTPDELILPPILIPRLQVTTPSPSTSTTTQPVHLAQDQFIKAKEQNLLLKRTLLNWFHWRCLTKQLLTWIQKELLTSENTPDTYIKRLPNQFKHFVTDGCYS